MSSNQRIPESEKPDAIARDIAGEGKRQGCIRNIALMLLAAAFWLGINTINVPSDSAAPPAALPGAVLATRTAIPPAVLPAGATPTVRK